MYRVLTDWPVALDSPDHQKPGGTMHDSSRNQKFNDKLYVLYPGPKIRLLDLGCAGGGFVADCLEDGHVAIGLEGSDYSTKWDGPGGTEAERAKRNPGKRAEWANIPNNLFTCDVTRPFSIEKHGLKYIVTDEVLWVPARFDVVTAWEIMEHLPEDRLDQVVTNVLNHLAYGGVWIMSVSTQHGDYHQTIRPRDWWLELMARHGLEHHQSMVDYFGYDWVRGPNQNAPCSFHLCVKRREV